MLLRYQSKILVILFTGICTKSYCREYFSTCVKLDHLLINKTTRVGAIDLHCTGYSRPVQKGNNKIHQPESRPKMYTLQLQSHPNPEYSKTNIQYPNPKRKIHNPYFNAIKESNLQLYISYEFYFLCTYTHIHLYSNLYLFPF